MQLMGGLASRFRGSGCCEDRSTHRSYLSVLITAWRSKDPISHRDPTLSDLVPLVTAVTKHKVAAASPAPTRHGGVEAADPCVKQLPSVPLPLCGESGGQATAD